MNEVVIPELLDLHLSMYLSVLFIIGSSLHESGPKLREYLEHLVIIELLWDGIDVSHISVSTRFLAPSLPLSLKSVSMSSG